MGDLIRKLKRCRLFESLSDADAEPLVRHARSRSFPRGAVVYSPGDAGNSVMVLVSGLLMVKVPTARAAGSTAVDGGRETILGFVTEGELFGEHAVFDGEPRRDCAEVVEDSEVLHLPRATLVSVLQRRADLALDFARLIGHRRQRIESRHADLLFSPSRERVIRILCELAEAHGDRAGNRVEIRLPLSHHDIAGLIGVSRETATLALGELQTDGLVEISRRRLVILDVRRLGLMGAGTASDPVGGSGDVSGLEQSD